MFVTHQNVPSIYPEKSRDFQLLSALIDVFVNSVRGGANKMSLQLSPELCDERMLSLVATRKGFFTSEYLPAAVQRNILAVFSQLRRMKGSQEALKISARAALKAYPLIDSVKVGITNKEGKNKVYEVVIKCVCVDWFDIDERCIREVMRYVLPAGYIIKLEQIVDDTTKVVYITL